MPLADTVMDPATAARYRADQSPGARQVSRSGVPLYNGRTREWEPNVRYQNGTWWSHIVPRIKNCPPVDTGTSTLVDMVLSATQTVGPGYEPARELVRRTFGLEGRAPRMRDTWEAMLRRLMRAPFQGAGAFEWVTRIDGEDATAQPAGTVYLERLCDISHRAVEAYLTDEVEQLVGLRVRIVDGYRYGSVDVPDSQILYLCYRPQGTTDYDGWGMWRAIAEEASDHGEVGNFLRIGARRFAVGDVDLTLDYDIAAKAQQPTHSDEWRREQAAAMAAWAKARESGADGYVVRMPWWRLTTFGGAGSGGNGGGYNPQALVQQRFGYEELILRQLAAEYLLVGGTSGGSYSAAEVKVTRAAAVARNLLDWVLSELDRQVVQRLIRINFPDLPPDQYPKIQAGGLRAPVFVEHAALLVQMAQAGVVTKTDALEDAVLEAFELPARTESRSPEQRNPQSPVAAPSDPDDGNAKDEAPV